MGNGEDTGRLVHELDSVMDWRSFEEVFPFNRASAGETFLRFVATQLATQVDRGYVPEKLQVTRTLMNEPFVSGILRFDGRRHRLRGLLRWDDERCDFAGSVSVEPIMTEEEEQAAMLRDGDWHLEQWKNRPALVGRRDGHMLATEYVGQAFDPDEWELIADYWDHQHCAFCWAKIAERGVGDFCEGYTNGKRWVCPDCFRKESPA